MNSGHPSFAYFLSDAWHRLRRPLVPTLISVLILFAATAAIFATTGLASASQQRTLERINSPSGRLITVTDSQGDAGLSPRSVDAVRSLSGVEWAAGVSPATDVTNGSIPGGSPVQARLLFGEAPRTITFANTQPGPPGHAVAGPGVGRVLGFSDGVGSVSSRTLQAVVAGGFNASEPLASLNSNVLVPTPTGDPGARMVTLWVSVSDVSSLSGVSAAVSDVLVADEPGKVQIERSSELALLGQDVAQEMAHTARLTVTGLLLAVALLVGAVQFGRVSGMARDIGRGRALGATRSTIIVQILINAGLCGILGATCGITFGLTLNWFLAGALPPGAFVAGVAILVVLASLVGSLPPALRAARLDPVRILRVP